MKECKRCHQLLNESEFYKDSSRNDGLQQWCKNCCKQYYINHKAEYNKRAAKWRDENRELLNERFRTRYRQTQTNYMVNKRHNDPLFHLHSNFASNLRMSLKTLTNGTVSKNGKSWEEIVGYTLQELKNYLETKFLPGMTWDNYGEWHVDHIIPISSFNITSLECDDFKKCWSLDNLQPLWAEDNIRKSNHIGPEWGNDK